MDWGRGSIRAETVAGLASPGCSNRIAGGFTHRHLFLTVWEAGSPEIRVLADLVSREVLSSASSYKGTTTMDRGSNLLN